MVTEGAGETARLLVCLLAARVLRLVDIAWVGGSFSLERGFSLGCGLSCEYSDEISDGVFALESISGRIVSLSSEKFANVANGFF